MNNNVTLKMIMEALQDFCCYYDDAELLKRVLNEVCSGHAARDLEAIMEKNKNKYKHLQNASQLKRLVSEINAKAGMTVWTTETMKALGDSFRKHGIKTKRVTQERFLSQEESEKALYSCCETVMEQYKKALNQTRSSSKRPPRYMTEDNAHVR
ncbi:MAG: hypothetical protein IJG57_02170 [Firmicutes bacterium]|nr:hypothetical protein [Bacillota bacterium]